MLAGEAVVCLVEEVVSEAGGVKHQHPGGYVALRRPQPGIARPIEAFDYLELPDFRDITLRRSIEIEASLLDQLERGGARDRLRRGEDGEDGIGGHIGILAEHALAGRTLIDVPRPVARHRHDARHAGAARDHASQDGVGGPFQFTGHKILPV